MTIRGNDRQSIFGDDRDRERFGERLVGRSVRKLKTIAGKERNVAKMLAAIEAEFERKASELKQAVCT